MQPSHPAPLLSANDLMRLLGVKRTTLWAHRKAGAFPKPLQIGSRILWRSQDVQRFIDERAAAANQATPH